MNPCILSCHFHNNYLLTHVWVIQVEHWWPCHIITSHHAHLLHNRWLELERCLLGGGCAHLQGVGIQQQLGIGMGVIVWEYYPPCPQLEGWSRQPSCGLSWDYHTYCISVLSVAWHSAYCCGMHQIYMCGLPCVRRHQVYISFFFAFSSSEFYIPEYFSSQHF